MKTLLITRNLEEGSPMNALKSDRLRILGESFITFEPIEFDDWDDEADMVVFYSQRGVVYGLANEDFRAFCIGKTLVTFGQATSDYLTDHYGLIADISGNGHADKLLNEVLNCQPSSVLFVQGDKSLRRLQSDERWNIPFSELVTYRSINREVNIVHEPDILVFTSPLNVAHYCAQNEIKKNQIVWAIGSTTASSLKPYCSGQIAIPDQPTEASLAQAIKRSLVTHS